MLGFLVGAAAVAGLIAWKRHRHHHWAAAGCGGEWHGPAGCGRGWHGPDHRGRHHGGFRGWGWRGAEYRLLAELDCTPAQERLVREELRALIDQVRALGDERRASREDLARAIAGRELDRGALMAMFTRHDQRLVELRAAITASLERVHGSLDERQRERLAELVRGGLSGAGWGGHGPYR